MSLETASMLSGTAPLLGSSASPNTPRDKTTKSLHDRKKARRFAFNGWRVGVAICASTAASVLVINIGLTIWASTKNGLNHGLATIQDGSCQKTKNLSLWLHLAINALSTTLLAASNYCMQCLSSPTREEIDRAHSRHIWLDIGVPSVRNLRKIAKSRIVLWWLLAFSGIPLHLLYNSAIFSTLSSQDYSVFVASEAIISGIGINWTAPTAIDFTLAEVFQNDSSWQNLTNEECVRAYGRSFVSSRSDVLAITSELNATSPLRGVSTADAIDSILRGEGSANSWLCSDYPDLKHWNYTFDSWSCDLDGLYKYLSNWSLPARGDESSKASSFPIQHCLSKSIEEHCRLQLSLLLMSIIIFCNFTKATCMYLVLQYQKNPPLVTLGDAIESFLEHRDLTTKNLCLAEKYTFTPNNWEDFGDLNRKYVKEKHRWFSSASQRRWLTCNVLCISTLLVAGVLLQIGLRNTQLMSRSMSHLWSLGFGAVTSESLVSWNKPGSGGLLLNVLVANSPQALLSFLFLTYNGLYTCMLMANEWSDYAHERKALRVTDPVGNQRSTYRLQIPYKYGIPLTIVSGILHWLVSQSLFLARIASYDSYGEEDTDEMVSTMGYSCIAIITVIIVGTIVVTLGILNGFRRYRPGMPIVGSCSAAISAACHAPREDVDAATLPLLWGAVSHPQGDGTVGHCCFTSFEASPPVEGEAYAGLTS